LEKGGGKKTKEKITFEEYPPILRVSTARWKGWGSRIKRGENEKENESYIRYKKILEEEREGEKKGKTSVEQMPKPAMETKMKEKKRKSLQGQTKKETKLRHFVPFYLPPKGHLKLG
jgi:hypothetical protein